MGADMIGYQTMLPTKLTAKEKKECLHHLNELEGLIKLPDFLSRLAKEESAEEPLLKELNGLSPWIPSEMNSLTYAEDDYEELDDLFTDILNVIPTAKKFLDNMDFDGRDVSYRTYRILGREFVSVFAGEMSWGEEPQGAGYELLKDLDKVGILSKIEGLSIPSEPMSIQFIKGEKI